MQQARITGQLEENAVEQGIAQDRRKEEHQVQGEDDRHQGSDNGHHQHGKIGKGQPEYQGPHTDVSIDFKLFHRQGI